MTTPTGAGVRGAFLFQTTILRRRAVVLGGGGIALVLTVLVTLGTILPASTTAGEGRRGNGITIAELERAQGVVQSMVNARFLLGILMLVVGASAIASTYSLGTLRVLMVREPRRLRLLSGLVLGAMAASALIAFLCAVVAVVASVLLAPAKSVSTSAWFTSDGVGWIASTTGQLMLALACYTALGCALGVVLRTPVASIAAGVVYLLIIENLIVGLVWKGGMDWLPGQVLQGVAAGGVSNPGDTVPGFGRSLLLTAVYAAAISVGCGALFTRRDVSL